MPNPESTEQREVETWTECSDCGWNLGQGHLLTPPIRGMLPVGVDCPKCGEPLVEVLSVSDHEQALRDEREKREAAERQRDTALLRLDGADVMRRNLYARATKAEAALAEVREALGLIAKCDDPDSPLSTKILAEHAQRALSPDSEPEKCERCGGRGEIPNPGASAFDSRQPCPTCHGTGEKPPEPAGDDQITVTLGREGAEAARQAIKHFAGQFARPYVGEAIAEFDAALSHDPTDPATDTPDPDQPQRCGGSGEGQPELVIADRLTPAEKERLVEWASVRNPQLRGAEAADILHIFDDGDVMIAEVERFYEAHGDPPGKPNSECRLAVIAAAILQPEEMLPLVERLVSSPSPASLPTSTEPDPFERLAREFERRARTCEELARAADDDGNLTHASIHRAARIAYHAAAHLARKAGEEGR